MKDCCNVGGVTRFPPNLFSGRLAARLNARTELPSAGSAFSPAAYRSLRRRARSIHRLGQWRAGGAYLLSLKPELCVSMSSAPSRPVAATPGFSGLGLTAAFVPPARSPCVTGLAGKLALGAGMYVLAGAALETLACRAGGW